MVFDLISQAIQRCLHGQMVGVISRLRPEGRMSSAAFNKWIAVVNAEKAKQEKMSAAVARFSPQGRAKSKSLRSWHLEAKERKRRQLAMKNVLARLTPEGRAKHLGMSAFKSRSPTWTTSAGPIAAADVQLSEDGFWITHTAHRVRTPIFASPYIKRGIFRFAFRISGSGAGLVVGVADATNQYPRDALEPMCWGLHLTHGALYTKRANSNKGVLSPKQVRGPAAYLPPGSLPAAGLDAHAARPCPTAPFPPGPAAYSAGTARGRAVCHATCHLTSPPLANLSSSLRAIGPPDDPPAPRPLTISR